MPRFSPRICVSFVSLCGVAGLAGCAMPPGPYIASTTTTTTTATTTAQVAQPTPIDGSVHGGNQPIVGSRVYLFAASTAGYGKASVSLLDSTKSGVYTDATGAYVATDAAGGFSMAGDYTCTPGQQLYLLALGGDALPPNGPENTAIGMVAMLGACTSGASSAAQFVTVNEVTTAAAAYALAGFFTSSTHLASSATANAAAGMTNAVATVSSLVDMATGVALSATPGGNGVAPQATLNTIANALVGCVNSVGAGAAACSGLFAATTMNGVAPATTMDAALNMARNPGANVAAVYALATATATFQPMLTAVPNDLTLSITYGASSLAGPYFPAFDAAGNLWVPGFLNSSLTELGPTGEVLSGSTGFTGGGLNEPYAVAVDASGNPWVTNFGPVGASTVTKFLANGTPAANAYACGTTCYFPAFDAAGNLWVSGTQRATVLSPAGAVLKTFATNNGDSGVAVDGSGNAWLIGAPGSLMRLGLPAVQASIPEPVTAAGGDELTTVAVDAGGNVWYASSKNSALGESSAAGTLVSPAGGFTGGGLKGPAGIAVDGSGRVWVANRDGSTLSGFGSDGTALSPAAGYQSQYVSNPRGLAVDPSGNVWLTNFTNNSVTEFVGIATPTATPVLPGNHGQRP